MYLLGLICGTLYLYSSYSPQLANQLHYSASDSSIIALCGTIGVAIAGPISGAVVDRKGYTVSLLIGGILIISSYIGLKRQFDYAWSNVQFSSFTIFLVGVGSTFINSACLKCCAVSFPVLECRYKFTTSIIWIKCSILFSYSICVLSW